MSASKELSKIKKEYEKLIEFIKQADQIYYGDNPEEYRQNNSPYYIEDKKYDTFYKRLKEIEKNYPNIIHKDSPTQTVGHARINFIEDQNRSTIKRVKHKLPMLSLENIYNNEEFYKWIEQLNKNIKKVKLIAELKIDGLAISIIYKDGKLIKAVSRGDGQIGEEITKNIKTIKNLPIQIPINNETIEVRGELYFPLQAFKEFNNKLKEKNQSTYQNPRNTAAGSIKLKDTNLFKKRGLKIIIYDLVQGIKYDSHFENMNYLKKIGFKINPNMILTDNIKKIDIFYEEAQQKRQIINNNQTSNSLDFDIDGIVLKLDDLKLRELIGKTNKFPKWAKAWKFKEAEAKTILRGIEYSISRIGKITPIAMVDIVNLSGSDIKRVSLYNYSNFKKLDLFYNDELLILKGGDIIPAIKEILYKSRKKNQIKIPTPKNCPSCNTKLIISKNEVEIFCTNHKCPARNIEKICYFVGKTGFNIDYLGEKQIETFFNLGWLIKLSDIFYLENYKEQMIALLGFNKINVNKILTGIENSKQIELHRFINALAIEKIGIETAKIIAEYVISWDNFLKIGYEELLELDQINKMLASSIFKWKNDNINKREVQRMQDLGVKIINTKIQAEIKGRAVITGKLTKTREKWELDLKNAGYKLQSSVSSQTNFLIAGKSPGKNKTEIAKKHNIKIISEQEANNLIKD